MCQFAQKGAKLETSESLCRPNASAKYAAVLCPVASRSRAMQN